MLVAWIDFDSCTLPSRGVGSILANSSGARKKARLASARRRARADSVIEHLQHTYIHHHTHAHTHSEIHAHAHAAIVFYDSLQLTSSMHEAKEKGHRAHGQNKIMHAYGPKSTPIAQGLAEDINAKHAYGSRSVPIAQGLVYDINTTHAFGLRESKRSYGFVSTPISRDHKGKRHKNGDVSKSPRACEQHTS